MEKIYSIKEAAEYLRCSTWLLYKLCKEKAIPHFKNGNRIRFSESGLKRYIDNQQNKNSK